MARAARKKTTKKKSAKKKSTKKKSTKKKSARRDALVPDAVLAVPQLAGRLTEEILELDRRGKRRLVHNVVEIGRRMLELQRILGFGRWLTWLTDHLPYPPRTAQRYIAVARFAEQFPEDFQAFAHLGLLKLVLLGQLRPEQRAALRNAGPLSIPGVRQRKRLEIMTIEEMASALLPPGGDTLGALPPAVPIDTVVRRFRHRIAALDAMADTLRNRAHELDRATLRELRRSVLAVAQELQAATQ